MTTARADGAGSGSRRGAVPGVRQHALLARQRAGGDRDAAAAEGSRRLARCQRADAASSGAGGSSMRCSTTRCACARRSTGSFSASARARRRRRATSRSSIRRWRRRRGGSAFPRAAARIPGSSPRRSASLGGALAPVIWSAADLLTPRQRAAHSPLRQRQVPLGVRRPQQGRHAPLVRHELVRQPRQGAPALRAEQEGLTSWPVAPQTGG